MKVNKYIFREYDIRGKVKDDFPPEVVLDLGKAFGTFIKRSGGQEIALSGDVRLSTPSLLVTSSKSLTNDLALLIYADVDEGLAAGEYVYLPDALTWTLYSVPLKSMTADEDSPGLITKVSLPLVKFIVPSPLDCTLIFGSNAASCVVRSSTTVALE